MTGHSETDNNRYLVKIPCVPNSLVELSLESTVRLLDSIRRIDSTRARFWAQRFLPPSIREIVLMFATNNVAAACANNNNNNNNNNNMNTVSKLWSILYSRHLRSIQIPPELDDRTRNGILMNLGHSSNENEEMSDRQFESTNGKSFVIGKSFQNNNATNDVIAPTEQTTDNKVTEAASLHSSPSSNSSFFTTATFVLSLSGKLGNPERRSVLTHLSQCSLLVVFCVRKGADDEMMAVLGRNCPLLQEVNVTGSHKVTDEGVALFLGLETLSGQSAATPGRSVATLNPAARTLKFVKMRSTGVRVQGVRLMLRHLEALQGIRCSSYDVLQAMASHFSGSRPGPLAMRFLDFSNCFTILSKFIHLMPNLIEVRIGSDAPPTLKSSFQRLKTDDQKFLESENSLKQLPKLKHLKTLVLKDFGNLQALTSLLGSAVGGRLRRLDLHYYSSSKPGLDLAGLGLNCPRLQTLTICDSCVCWQPWKKQKIPEKEGKKVLFPTLETCRLLRVDYDDPAEDWAFILRHSGPCLRSVHLEACRGMTDPAVLSLLQEMSENEVTNLEQFLVIGHDNRLTARTVFRLTNQCARLRWIGDLRDWNISRSERDVIRGSLDHDWQMRRRQQQQQLQQQQQQQQDAPWPFFDEGSCCSIVLDTEQIASKLMYL